MSITERRHGTGSDREVGKALSDGFKEMVREDGAALTPMALLTALGLKFRDGILPQDVLTVFKKNAPDLPLNYGWTVLPSDIEAFDDACKATFWDLQPLLPRHTQENLSKIFPSNSSARDLGRVT